MKKWLKAVIIGAAVLIASWLVISYVVGIFTTVKYGTPHYRPKV